MSYGCLGAAPNAAHLALAELEAAWSEGDFVIVTQNIDDLHERAGNRAVIHMHGEVLQALCASCGNRWEAAREMKPDTPCPTCGRSTARPDVVWFGEMPYHMDRIGALLANADLFVSIGTSGTVYPAAGFAAEARASGARTLEMTLEPSEVGHLFQEVRHGTATETVPAWVAGLLGR